MKNLRISDSAIVYPETFVPQLGGTREFIKEEKELQSSSPCRTEFQAQGTLTSWLIYHSVKCSKKLTHRS